jgi:UDP-glucose 4-epimerase
MSVIWVTGAKGFIGKHLCSHLSKQGKQVIGIGHGTWSLDIAKNAGVSYWVNGEIENANLSQLLKNSGAPDIIYHLAGGSSVALSLQSPNEDFRRTVTSTATLLEWIRLFVPTTQLVMISSAAVYGDNKISHIPEYGNYTPYSPYGFHKRSSELMCESYASSFGLKVIIVRLFSVYGSGLQKQLLWDLCCRLSQLPNQLEMNGTGEELRDWLYIEDTIRLLVNIPDLTSDNFLIINGGTGKGTCIKDVVSMICRAWRLSPEILFSGCQRPGDPISLVANIEKIDKLGFTSLYDLEIGISKYVEWFKEQ